MYLAIQVNGATNWYSQVTQLEGVEYVFELLWSDREACWFLGVSDQDGNAIALGIKLITSWPLLRRFRDARLPPGRLFLLDMTGAKGEISAPTDLGGRFKLKYITSDDADIGAFDAQYP